MKFTIKYLTSSYDGARPPACLSACMTSQYTQHRLLPYACRLLLLGGNTSHPQHGGPSASAQYCIVAWAERLFEARRLCVNINRLRPAIGWMPVHLCWRSQKELKGLFPGASYFKQNLHDSGVGTSTGIAIRASNLSAAKFSAHEA